MAIQINCPNCGNNFDIENTLSKEIEQKLEQKYQLKLNSSLQQLETEKHKLIEEQKIFEEKKKKENELFLQKINQEKQKLQDELQVSIRKSVSADYENQLKLLQQAAEDNQEKLKEAREKELEFLQKENQLKNKEAEIEIRIQRLLNNEREKLAREIRSIEEQKLQNLELQYQLRLAEKDKQLTDQKKLAEEMKRKAEQGSMQLQGEVQELMLEEILRNFFPFDFVSEVPKGRKGADCLLTVRNNSGNECGTILFESKRTLRWSNEWIEKLKQDKVNCSAHIAVLVSQTLPDKCDDSFEYKDGVWICSFKDVKILALALREGIIKIFQEAKKQESKEDKVQSLYNYMTSHEFAAQWKAIRDVFKNMKQSVDDERKAMEKIWKNREKQLERALANSNYIMASIEGISGKNSFDLNLLSNEQQMLD
ncbi:MAG: DUF2130 domain-containing protein [Chitinophagaceae bacterium]